MFFYIKNLSATTAGRMAKPWEHKTKAPYDSLSKGEFEVWSMNQNTDHVFLSGAEGENPNMRVNDSVNPVCALHAFFADYDMEPGVLGKDPMSTIQKKLSGGYLPTYFTVSRNKDRCRLMWDFSKAISMCGTDHGNRFLETLAKLLKADRVFGTKSGFDKSSCRVSQYFEIGRKWEPVEGSEPLPFELLAMWDMDVFKALRRKVVGTKSTIPFEAVQEEVNRRWPGRVPKFEVGAHCVRFWDPASDSENGSLIMEDGIRVYVTTNGVDGFYPWEKIFDMEFIERHRSAVYNNTLSDCYFDNRDKYWMKNDRGDFDSSSKDMFIRELAVMGFSRAVSKGETSSPVEQIMTRIKATNRVTDTVSYVYHNQGMYKRRNGERVLNISTVKVTDPKAGPPLFREGAAWNSKEVHDAFPFIYEVITGLFQSSVKCMKGEKLCTQLEYFISWLSYFYSRSYEFKPSPGQALFICGPSNSGKTFTSRVIVGNLMGGFSEAKDYFKGTSEWNNDVNKAGVLVVDDDEGSSNHQMARTFQARVKAYVANGVVRVKQKYHDASDVPLMNRLIVTLNDSPADKQILPGLDETIKDKVSFLLLPAGEERTWRTPMQGATMEWGKNEELVVRELPAFAKWLYEYEIPEYLKDDRFGTKSLQHAKLSMSFSLQTGFGQEVIEALEILFRNTGEGFSGTATELLAALESVSSTLKRNVNPKQLSRSLMSLEADGFEIKVTTVKSLTNYTMEPDMLEKWAEQHKELDGSNT